MVAKRHIAVDNDGRLMIVHLGAEFPIVPASKRYWIPFANAGRKVKRLFASVRKTASN